MPRNPAVNLTTEQALIRARRMLDSARKLEQAAEQVAEARTPNLRDAAEEIKDNRLLDHRVATTPDVLIPVLEALMLAAVQADTKH